MQLKVDDILSSKVRITSAMVELHHVSDRRNVTAIHFVFEVMK